MTAIFRVWQMSFCVVFFVLPGVVLSAFSLSVEGKKIMALLGQGNVPLQDTSDRPLQEWKMSRKLLGQWWRDQRQLEHEVFLSA